MKKLLINIILLISISGCTFIRHTSVTAKIKDGQYGIAKGNGNAVYEATTMFSFLCKGLNK